MSQRPKVLLLLPHLGVGGAQQVLTHLSRRLSREKYELHFGVMVPLETDRDRLPADAIVHGLSARRVRGGALQLLRLVHRIEPDLILSGMAHLSFLVLLLRPLFPRRTAVLVRQTGTVSASLRYDKIPCYTRLLYRLLYCHADRAICQTEAMANDMVAELGIAARRVAVLPNPVDVDGIHRAMAGSARLWTGCGPHLLAIGRLAREKGFDLLLTAMAQVRARFPAADLLLAGAGPQEAALKAECRRLSLEDAVHFAGHVELPHLHFPGATLFVLPSRYEGMPNALLEAAAGGLPIVATPACEGLCDLLRRQPGVWLAKDISAQALADSLLQALAVLAAGERFDHTFVEPFRMERAIRAYEELIDATLEARRS